MKFDLKHLKSVIQNMDHNELSQTREQLCEALALIIHESETRPKISEEESREDLGVIDVI